MSLLLQLAGPLISLFSKLVGFWMAYRAGVKDKKIAELEAENETMKKWQDIEAKDMSPEAAYDRLKKKAPKE